MNDKELISKISEELSSKLVKRFGNKIKSIILYGSYARGDNRKDSDIDIMVLFDCPKDEVMKYRKEISWIASDIGVDHDVLVSIVIRDITSFKNNQQILPFYQNILKEGVTLYGTV